MERASVDFSGFRLKLWNTLCFLEGFLLSMKGLLCRVLPPSPLLVSVLETRFRPCALLEQFSSWVPGVGGWLGAAGACHDGIAAARPRGCCRQTLFSPPDRVGCKRCSLLIGLLFIPKFVWSGYLGALSCYDACVRDGWPAKRDLLPSSKIFQAKPQTNNCWCVALPEASPSGSFCAGREALRHVSRCWRCAGSDDRSLRFCAMVCYRNFAFREEMTKYISYQNLWCAV